MIPVAVLLGCGGAGIAIVTCAFYGWGQLTRRLAGLPNGTWPVSAALGLALVLFLGGVLNLCRVAYPGALAGIIIVGLILAVLAVRQDRAGPQRRQDASACWHIVPWSIATVVLTGSAIVTQLAPLLYNHGDDFREFFAHAVRMVETGTLYGSPLNALGGEVLGGQAFLQGFIVGYFPLKFINGADAVFCFFLCLTLAGSVALGRPAVWLPGLIGTLAVLMIDPQYVNVSSLYSMAAMISALMIINVDPRERGDGISQRWRQAAAPALFYAGAIALKPTSIVFLGLQFGMAGTASFWTTGDWRTSISNAGRIATWSVVFLTPWLLLYAPYYSLAFTHPIGVPLTPVPEVVEPLSLVSLLSPAGTFYGASRLSYTCLATGLFLCALHATLRLRSDPATRKSHMGLASASAAAAATYLFWTLFGPRMQESVNTVRYSIPVLIGAASAAFPLWAAITARRNVAVCTTMAVFLLLLFSSSMHQRLGTLLHQRSELAYLHKWRPAALNRNREFQERVLDGALTAEVQRLQEEIPPGRTILAWTGTPFLLDYGRNHVIDMNVAGLDQPWGRIPSVRYVTWQESGYGTHTEEVLNYEIAVFGRRTGKLDARALDVLHWLQEVVPASKIIDDMDGVLVIETDEKTLQPPN